MKAELMDTSVVYEKSGSVAENVGAIVTLIIGVGVATLVLIFVGVLGGQVYQQTAADIEAINATNPTVYNYTNNAIVSGFKSLQITGNYMPIIILAVIIFIVLGLVTNLGGGGRQPGSSAL